MKGRQDEIKEVKQLMESTDEPDRPLFLERHIKTQNHRNYCSSLLGYQILFCFLA